MADEVEDTVEEETLTETEEGEVQAEPEFDEINFEGEAAPASGERDTGLVKHLRDEIRKRDALLAERPAPQQVQLGPKPTLASCEFDEERYEDELDSWKDQKATSERQATADQTQRQQVRQEFEQAEQSYRDKRSALRFSDVEEAEAVTDASMNQIQLATIVSVAKNAAAVKYALGKHPAKLAELSKLQNPLKLAYAVAEFERSFSVMPRRQVTEPEEIATGSASMSIKTDKELDRLEKEAERTGDRNKVIAHKRALKSKAA